MNGNVKLSTLYELDHTIHSFKENMGTIKADFDTMVEKFFVHFRKQRQELNNRLLNAEKVLEVAEKNLRIIELRRRPFYNDEQNDNLIKKHMIIIGARNKVMRARQERDRCKELLQRCDRIINNCSTRKGYHNGIYKTIEMSLVNASIELGHHIDNVIDYLNTSMGMSSKSSAEIGNYITGSNIVKKNANCVFFINGGKPLVNAKITIVDNEPFGFGQIDILTDNSGQISIPYHKTSDCSIFIEGTEVYSGPLFKYMEYNRNQDNKVAYSDCE